MRPVLSCFQVYAHPKPKINKTCKRNAFIYGHFQKGLYNTNGTQLPVDENV